MPVVFVHGVSNRSGAEYQRSKDARDRALKETVLRRPDGAPYDGHIIEGYWGDLGAPVDGGIRSLPGTKHVALGPQSDLTVNGAILAAFGEEFLAEIANVSPTEAVELLFLGIEAEAEASGYELPPELLRFGAAAAVIAENLEKEGLGLAARSNDEALINLIKLVRSRGETKSFVGLGGGDEVKWLKSGLNFLTAAATGAASNVAHRVQSTTGNARRLLSLTALSTFRPSLSRDAGLFLGDAFVYLTSRGTPEVPGSIPLRIGERLREGIELRTPDDPLIVIGHSLGGVILYDILTGFPPVGTSNDGFCIDALVTVGSQVGVFAELGRFIVQGGSPALDPGKKLPRPILVRQWLNVYDRTDIFAFRAEAVFDGVFDYDFSNATGTLSSHGAYLRSPIFWERLRVRLHTPPSREDALVP